MPPTSRRLAAACAAVIALGAALLVAGPAPVAAEPGVYAAWTIGEVIDADGRHQGYAGTMTLPAGYPVATWTSDARADSAVESGASTWIPVASPFGAVYGPNQNQPYLRLRPRADTPTGPSTTTYTFATPTPSSGWAFALGDIDSDQVEVSAEDAAGDPVPVAGLGFQSVYNYCDATPRPSTCSGMTPPYDLPSWQPGTDSGLLVGNDGAVDTTGASGWFQPTVPLKTLSLTFTRRAGFPVYQTWFAALPTTEPTTTSTSSTSTTSTTSPSSTTTTTALPTTSTTTPGSTTSSTSSTSSSSTVAPPLLGHPGHPGGPGPHRGGGRSLPATGRALGGLTLVGVGMIGAGLVALRARRRPA